MGSNTGSKDTQKFATFSLSKHRSKEWPSGRTGPGPSAHCKWEVLVASTACSI
jgi:hypothetical protein